MRAVRLDSFARQYQKLPVEVRRKVDRQITRLMQSLRHPSLYAKKMAGQSDVWEARVDYRHRMTFQIQGDMIVLRAVGAHDVLRTP